MSHLFSQPSELLNWTGPLPCAVLEELKCLSCTGCTVVFPSTPERQVFLPQASQLRSIGATGLPQTERRQELLRARIGSIVHTC